MQPRVQAHAAEPLFALDENDFLAKIRCVKSRRITTGAGANNYNFRFDRIHRKLKLHRIFTEIFKRLHQIHREPRGAAAVNDAMIVAQRNRREQARLDLAVAHDGF